MPSRTPEQISKFLDTHMYKMDLGNQYFGDEPNSYRKPWDSASARWLLMASWPYEAAAGNQSIPTVYKAINIGREDFLCDRFYLPATPRDLKTFESAGFPLFGIESKHQVMDFDVVATSIAYPVLTMSFVKMLTMSGVLPRWKDREEQGLEKFPMVIVGGQAYGAPEVLAPICDAVWCFSGDTQFITRDGNRALRDVVGETVEVWTEAGWHKAEGKSLGRQELTKFTFAPVSYLEPGVTTSQGKRPAYAYPGKWRQNSVSRYRVTERATADHRWELVDGSVTTALKVGDIVKSSAPVVEDTEDELRGFVHGVAFGDLSRNWSARRVMSFNGRLFGQKAELLPQLRQSGMVATVSYSEYYDYDPFVTIHADCDLKDYPPSDSSSSYVHGFIRGIAATDGNLSLKSRAKVGKDSEVLFSTRADFAPWIEANAAYGGWLVRSVLAEVSDRLDPQGKLHVDYALWRVTVSKPSSAWKVVAAECDGVEEVYCVVVPGIHRFTLSSGIYTGNCGEVEDEPNNPGIAAVTARIAQFKKEGRWQTERLECYKDMAKEFNFLYFPRFIDVQYAYEDRSHVKVGPHLSKQVVSYTSNLEGMRMPILKRIVKDMDAIEPLTDPPLLYSDPGLGAGDLEVGRGCPAWCVSHSEFVFVPDVGISRVGHLALDKHYHPGEGQPSVQLTQRGQVRDTTCVIDQGVKPVVRVRTEQGHYIDCTPDHQIEMHTVRSGKLSRGQLEWRRADALQPGDIVPIHYGQRAFGSYQSLPQLGLKLDEQIAWLVGFLIGDGALPLSGGVSMCVESGSAIEAFVIQAMSESFGRKTPAGHKIGNGIITEYRYHGKFWRSAFMADFGMSAGRATQDSKHFVPDAIFKSPESVQQSFLMGLFEADGNVEEGFIRLVTVSERLAREVSLLCLNLGVPANWHRKTVPVDRGIVKGGCGFAYHVNVRKALDADVSWWHFISPVKEARAETFRRPLAVDLAAKNVNYLQSRKSPIMARVVSVEDRGEAPVADFMVPDGEAFDCSGLVVHNCSFCALTYRQKPYRQRSVPYMVDFASEFKTNMGGTGLVPFMPDFPMHTQRKKLIRDLMVNVTDEVDAGAMRVDDFIADGDFILLQVHGGLDGVTLGVEGNSQRMRDLVGKGTSDADIREAVARGIRAGIRKFKMFMISNLPGEDEGDVFRILKLAKDLADIRDGMDQPSVRIQFSWTPLLVEANTPFQWFSPPTSTRALGDVWEEFRDLKIEFKLGGKSSRLTSRVLTPEGWVLVKDLAVGQRIVDPHGWQSELVGFEDNEPEPVYRVQWTDGTWAEVGAGHSWSVLRWVRRGGQWQKIESLLTTVEMIAYQKTSYPSLELVNSAGLAGVDFGDGSELEIDPYLLGLLLGDGCISGRKYGFTQDDNDVSVVEELRSLLEPWGVEVKREQGSVKDYYFTGQHIALRPALVGLGLHGKTSHTKFVPESYKWTSAKNRLALLQGLMDTDGWAQSGYGGFSSASEQLRDDVADLARSLGLQVRTSVKQTKSSPAYQARVFRTVDLPVFRLARKLTDLPLPSVRHVNRSLQSIVQVAVEPTRCLEVSAPSALYVTDEWVPTHNAEPNKAAFFQLCQRASRDVGEAIVDAMVSFDQACWGGVPKTSNGKLGVKDRMEQTLRDRGFLNAYGDCFDERFKHDMFGWEFIDQGVSTELLWVTYLQMREFVEQTDSHTYDLNFDDTYHGNEWIARSFVGDTQVVLADGTTATIEELAGHSGWLLSRDFERDTSTFAHFPEVWSHGVRHDLITVELDDGTEITCTPDHEFILVDGSVVEAQYLTPEMDLATATMSEATAATSTSAV